MATEYKKLDKAIDYDHDAVDELVAAMTELKEIRDRASYLEEILKENKALHPFVWITADGDIKAHHNIEDDHFKNILSHLVATGRPISKELRSEARRRKILVPSAGISGRRTLAATVAQVYQMTHNDNDDFIDQDDNY